MPGKRPSGTPLELRIVGRHLPGRRCVGYENIHVGVQRGAEVIDLVPGDAAEAVWRVTLIVEDVGVEDIGMDGALDFRGPFVHGSRGARFLYLSWGVVGSDGRFAMFRRAKLHLSAIEDAMVRETLQCGSAITITLDLSDERGNPRCASLRPPHIMWRADSTLDQARTPSPAGTRRFDA